MREARHRAAGAPARQRRQAVQQRPEQAVAEAREATRKPVEARPRQRECRKAHGEPFGALWRGGGRCGRTFAHLRAQVQQQLRDVDLERADVAARAAQGTREGGAAACASGTSCGVTTAPIGPG